MLYWLYKSRETGLGDFGRAAFLYMDKPYQVNLSLEEWKFWQRLQQLRKTCNGKLLLEWGKDRLTWYLVGKPEHKDDV